MVIYDKGVEVPPYSDTPEQFHMSYHTVRRRSCLCRSKSRCASNARPSSTGSAPGRPACSDAWTGVKVVRILEAAQKSLLNSGARENTDL